MIFLTRKMLFFHATSQMSDNAGENSPFLLSTWRLFGVIRDIKASQSLSFYLFLFFYGPIISPWGLPWGLSSKKNPPAQCRRHRFDPWVGKILQRWKWQPIPVSLPGKTHGQRSLAGCSPWGCKKVQHYLVTK